MPLTRIVVADDDADFRLAVCTLLRTMAPSVSVVADVADGEQALAVARRERPAVVLTDLIMPRLNGVELARRIRQELPDTRIIIMSSHTEDTYRLLASDSDADLFITKGVVATRLVSAIHDVTDRSGDRARETRLGDLLHADRRRPRASETQWVGLVRAVASGDPRALQVLYEQMHRVVFTLLLRIARNRRAAEDLTVEVFDDVWRTASTYDPAGRSVVGWITDRARSRAMAHVRDGAERTRAGTVAAPPSTASGPSEGAEHDVLDPPAPLWERLAPRIAAPAGAGRELAGSHMLPEPAWEEAGTGIFYKLLATDAEADRVSMLVRLAPGAAYPPHRHAGLEELYLLHGELVIDGRILHPGDYNRAEAGTGDELVWSRTGCTCVLLTSTRDVLR